MQKLIYLRCPLVKEEAHYVMQSVDRYGTGDPIRREILPPNNYLNDARIEIDYICTLLNCNCKCNGNLKECKEEN